MKIAKGVGLVIGKFYPFHLGHKFLIETAISKVKRLVVIVCQTDRYKIPVEIRANWIRRTFPSVDVKIYHHSSEMDSNSTDMSEPWAKATVEFLSYAPEVVFSSENYGEVYAGFMGSKHVLVDLLRKQFDISGSKLRGDLNKYWDYLTPETKGYFALRVAVVGAESTGTTTLACDMARELQTAWVPEYGRVYYEGKMTGKNLNDWDSSEFAHIAESQNDLEDELAKSANKVLICDTNSFATEIWHERYVGFMNKELEKISSKNPADFYIVTNTEIPFVQDGTRDGEHIRQRMHERFVEELRKRKFNYIVVSGSREKRLEDAIKVVRKLKRNVFGGMGD